MNIIKNSITQAEYTALLNQVNNWGKSSSTQLTQSTTHKLVVGTDDDFSYIDFKTVDDDTLITNLTIKADGSLGGRAIKTELYSNSSGTNGTITLSQSYKNFTRIKVYFHDNGVNNMVELHTANGGQVNLANVYTTTNGDTTYIHSALLTFSGTTATFSRNGVLSLKSDEYAPNMSAQYGVYVKKIVGYKY